MSHADGQSPEEPVSFAKQVYHGISERNVSFMAGSIAYQAFVSLIPLLVLVFFLVSAVGDEATAERVTAATEGFLPESGQQLLGDTIEGSVASAGASIIGLVTLLWGSLKIFRSLDTAFSEIYDSTGENSIVNQLHDALIVFGAIATAMVAAGVASAVFALLPDTAWIGLLNPILLVIGLTLAFFPMYYYFPDVDVSWREVLPGVVVAAVGWAALQGLFQVYVALAGGGGAGDALGAILLLLTWLYFGGFVLLIGAVVNATYGGWIVDDESDADSNDDFDHIMDDESVSDAERWDRIVSRDRDRLEEQLVERSRERDRLRNDLAAERSRRDDLEVETRTLTERVEQLEQENDRLWDRLDRRRRPRWRRFVGRLFGRFGFLRVGNVRQRQE